MKLERFEKIREYRLFRDFAWPKALEDFGRFNLIYGWNGTGKTTLSHLFKAIQTATAVSEGEVEIVFDGTQVSGSRLAETALPPVRVFNRETVARSVFESSDEALAHLPPVYVFGEESAEKQRQLDALKSQLPMLTDEARRAADQETKATKELNEYATNAARTIKNLLVAPGGSFNNYNAADFKSGIAGFNLAPTPTLLPEELQALLAVKDAKPMATVQVPSVSFPDVFQLKREVQEALRKTVVSKVIAELAADPPTAAWVQEGLRLHAHGGDAATCKFCEQPLPSKRLRQLEAHFNDQFRQFTTDLQGLSEHIVNAARSLKETRFPTSTELYPELRSAYEDELRSFEIHLSNVHSGMLALADAVRSKQERVFESLELESLLVGGSGRPDDKKTWLSVLLTAMSTGLSSVAEFMGKQALERMQELVKKHNAKSASFAEEVKTARDRLHDNELANALDGWLDRQNQLTAASQARASANEKKSEVEGEIRQLEADILAHRPPADELNRELVAYLGHDEIQVEVEDTGYRLVRRGGAATNLSDGERTAIAFLYFLKSLGDRSFDLKHGIVVVDDPISSLDSNSIYSAFGFMKRRVCDAGQLFVLTHNYTFLRQVRNWFKHANRRKTKSGPPAHFYMLRASYVDGWNGPQNPRTQSPT
ncbi:AAA family ATPase [Ralstonia pseudosolanacearum]|uniref:AAA family ATPase n=1 Tax=Ralstonia pseudosolanacearum TaxID=1310165 RepID=UPI003D2EFE43